MLRRKMSNGGVRERGAAEDSMEVMESISNKGSLRHLWDIGQVEILSLYV